MNVIGEVGLVESDGDLNVMREGGVVGHGSTLITGQDGEGLLRFPDGAEIWIGPHSSLRLDFFGMDPPFGEGEEGRVTSTASLYLERGEVIAKTKRPYHPKPREFSEDISSFSIQTPFARFSLFRTYDPETDTFSDAGLGWVYCGDGGVVGGVERGTVIVERSGNAVFKNDADNLFTELVVVAEEGGGEIIASKDTDWRPEKTFLEADIGKIWKKADEGGSEP
jgi:hypothetical protein